MNKYKHIVFPPSNRDLLTKLKDELDRVWKYSLQHLDDEICMRMRHTAMDGTIEVFVDPCPSSEVQEVLERYGAQVCPPPSCVLLSEEWKRSSPWNHPGNTVQ